MDDHEQVSRGSAVVSGVSGSGDPQPHALIHSLGNVEVDVGILGQPSVTTAVGTLLRGGLTLTATVGTVTDGDHVPEGTPADLLDLTGSTAGGTGVDLSVLTSGTLAGLADHGVGHIQVDLLPLEDILECDLQIVSEGLPLLGGVAGPTGASAPEHPAEQVTEDVADVIGTGEVAPLEATLTELLVDRIVTVLVVELPLLRIREDLVGLRDLLELGLCDLLGLG